MSALPRVAVTVALPAELLFSVAAALPSLSVVAEAVTVPRVVAKVTDLPTTGFPFVVSTACSVMVAASLPSAIIADLLEEMLRVIPRSVMASVSKLLPTVAWTVPLLLVESAASAVKVVDVCPLVLVVDEAGLTEPAPEILAQETI